MDAKKQIRGFVCGGFDGSIGAVSKKIERKKTDKKTHKNEIKMLSTNNQFLKKKRAKSLASVK